MADTDNKTTSTKENPNQESTTETVEKTEAPQEPEHIPTLAEDYNELIKMNLLRNVMIRMQYGRYPNKKIDDILKRRMEFDESMFQGPRVARIAITIMLFFFICSLSYIAICVLGFNALKEPASFFLSSLFLGGCGFAIFNNLSAPDEKKLKAAIKERMTEYEVEIRIEQKKGLNT